MNMITKEVIEKILYLDVKTVGAYPTLEEVEKKDPYLFKLWSKQCKWLVKYLNSDEPSDTHSLWINKSGLFPEFGRIVCVSVGVFNNGEKKIKSFCGDNEKEILININKILFNSRNKNYKLGGHNIKNFVIPYLGKRMLINSIIPDLIIQMLDKKPWENSSLDLSEIFSFGSWRHSFDSLELISYSLGTGKVDIDIENSDIHHYYWDNLELEKIKKYSEDNLSLVMDTFMKISQI